MSRESQRSTSAKMLYRPVGMVTSVVAGMLASAVFRQVWKRAVHGGDADPPRALDSEYPLAEILGAAVVQGAIYAVV